MTQNPDHLTTQRPIIGKRSRIGYWIGGLVLLGIIIIGIIALAHYRHATTCVTSAETPCQ
jgi:hypothetical protein